MADLQHAKDLQHPKHVMPHNQQWGQLITDPGGNIRRNGSRLLLRGSRDAADSEAERQTREFDVSMGGTARPCKEERAPAGGLLRPAQSPTLPCARRIRRIRALHRFVRHDKFQLCEQIPCRTIAASWSMLKGRCSRRKVGSNLDRDSDWRSIIT